MKKSQYRFILACIFFFALGLFIYGWSLVESSTSLGAL